MKKLCLILSLFLAIPIVSADVASDDKDMDVQYGDDASITVKDGYNDGGASSTSRVWVEVCGVTADSIGSNYVGNLEENFPVELTFNTRADTPCGWGEKTASVYARSTGLKGTRDTEKIGEVNLKITSARNQPHRGDFLVVKMDVDQEDHGILNWFGVTDKNWGTQNQAKAPATGYVLVNEKDGLSGNEKAKYPIGSKVLSSNGPVMMKGGVIANPLATDPYDASNSMIKCGAKGGDLDTGHGGDDELVKGCGVLEGSFGDDDGANDPKAIVQQGFTSGNNWEADSSVVDISVDESTPVHYDGEFIPQGSLITGYREVADIKDTANKNRKRFYICRGTGSSIDGVTVDLYPGTNSKEELYRCDTKGNGATSEEQWRDNIANDWEKVTRCQDGLNNDQDGGTDLDDVDCNGNPTKDSEAPQKCAPIISSDVSNTNGDDITEKVALYDYNGNGNGQYSPASNSCTYDSMDDDVDYHNKPAEVFVCDNGNLDQYSGPTKDSKMDEWCSNLETRLNLDGGSDLPSPMPAVQYFVPKSAIPEGQNKWAIDATDKGFKPNYGLQALHDAEKKYSDSDEPNHDASTWSERTMEGLAGYTNDNPDNYIDAWKVGNATGLYNPDVDKQSGTITDDGVFDGGFYGNCEPGDMWVKNGANWGCDPGDVGSQRMVINTYYLKNLRDDSGNPTYAGFRINTSELRKWEAAHLVSAGADTDLINPMQVRAQCWHGGPGDKPPVSEVANVTETVEKTSNGKLKNMSVIADLPATSVNKDQPRSYSCIFGLRQAVYRDSNGNTPKYASTSTNVWFNGEPGYSDQPTKKDAAYIAEGVDFNGMIQTKTQPITVPVTDEFEGTELDWLKSNESSTYTGSSNLWSGFPISDAATSDDPCLEDPDNLELVKHPSYSAKHNCGDR